MIHTNYSLSARRNPKDAAMKRDSFLKSFARNEEGSILLIFGLMVVLLVAVSGAGIDLGVQQIARAHLQHSIDAANTSTASILNEDAFSGLSDSARITMATQTAQRYYQLNFAPTFNNIARPPLSTTVAGSNITLSATMDVPTVFMSNFGVPPLVTGATSVVNISNTQQNIDVIMVLDNTSSLGETMPSGLTRLQSLKNAETSFITNILGAPGAVSSTNRITAVSWAAYVMGQMDWTYSSDTARAFITALDGSGSGTVSSVGMGWAVTKSSSFRSTSNITKTVVFMTDGGNRNGGATGYVPLINKATLDQCQALKDNNVVIYTVGVGDEMDYCDAYTGVWNEAMATDPTNASLYSGTDTNCSSRTDAATGYPAPGYPATASARYLCHIAAGWGSGDCVGTPASPGTCNFVDFPVAGPNSQYFCPKPFLQACASDVSKAFTANDSAALNAAFSAIGESIKKVRISE